MARKAITYERLLKRENKYKSFRFFFTILLILAGVLFIRHVDLRLQEYEYNQPVNVVERFLSDIEAGKAYEKFSEEVNALSELSKETPLSYREMVQSKSEEMQYYLLSGSEKVASVTLAKRDPAAGENYSRWNISGVEMIVSPERLAMDLLKKMQSQDFSYVVENADPSLYPAETKEDLKKHILSITKDGELTLAEGEAPGTNQKNFMYLLNGEPFFEITLKVNISNANVWNFAGGVPHFIHTAVYEADIPANGNLYVNGEKASDEWIKNTYESEHASRVAEDVVNPVDLTIRHYEIPFAFTSPEFTVKDENGEEIPFTMNEKKLSVPPSSSLAEFEFLTQTLEDATERIAEFFVGKTEIKNVTRYVEYSSSAYKVMYEYNLWKSLKAGSAKMETFEIKSMTKLGDNCVVAEISAMYKAYYSDKNIIDYPLNYTLYMHPVKDRWLVYDFISE